MAVRVKRRIGFNLPLPFQDIENKAKKLMSTFVIFI